MPNGLYGLIARPQEPPAWDYLKSKQNILAIKGMEQELGDYEENKNWLRKQRGMAEEKFGWERGAQQTAQKALPLTEHLRAMKSMIESGQDLNWDKYESFRAKHIKAGLFPETFPEPEFFIQQAQKMSLPGNEVTAQDVLQLWKSKFFPASEKMLEMLKAQSGQTEAEAKYITATKPEKTEIEKPLGVVGKEQFDLDRLTKEDLERVKKGEVPKNTEAINAIKSQMSRIQEPPETSEWKLFLAEGKRQKKTDQQILDEWQKRVIGRSTQNVYIGQTPQGEMVTMPSKGIPSPTVTPGPPGGVGPKTMSEDFKKDLTAVGQAEDLINQLKGQWEGVGITDRTSAVTSYMAGKIGKNAKAKIYADMRDAFLGNISRSIAAERGVLTTQDIDRIAKTLPKIGLDLSSVDNQTEGKMKWGQIADVLKSANDRLEKRQRMTTANPTGKGVRKTTEKGVKELSDAELLKKLEGK